MNFFFRISLHSMYEKLCIKSKLLCCIDFVLKGVKELLRYSMAVKCPANKRKKPLFSACVYRQCNDKNIDLLILLASD